MTQTPMMRQYQEIKAQYPGALLLFRLGDFYEMFYDDAVLASRLLGLTLTSRSKGEKAVPMAGVPHHSVHAYVKRLIQAGYKVALCDQIEDPREAQGLVDRDVTRVITPGTVTEDSLLESKDHNYLAALLLEGDAVGLSWVDLSTGQFHAEDLPAAHLGDELTRLNPTELLLPESLASAADGRLERFRRETGAMITPRPDWAFGRDTAQKTLFEHFRVQSLEGFGCGSLGPSLSAAGATLQYLQETQKISLGHIRRLTRMSDSDRVVLDRSTQLSLELTRTLREGARKGSLLGVLDRTLTPMGGRLLKEWIVGPLRRIEEITARQDGVEEFFKDRALRQEARARLNEVYDIERLTARVATARANARDLLALRRSLEPLPALKERLSAAGNARLRAIGGRLDTVDEARALIGAAIAADPPALLKEGGLIREGYSAELDELRSIQRDGKSWIARFQASEIERTKIPSLKVGYNQVFGYYIEVTHTHQQKIPADYLRKQTLKNAERYVTPELKEYEARVLTAEDRARDIEYDLFLRVRDEVGRHAGRLQETAHLLAETDALASLADVAAEYRYVRPQMTEGCEVEIRDGRHPVLERTLSEPFVPNDTALDGANDADHDHHRPEHGGQIHVHPPDGADRADGARRLVRPGRLGADRADGPHLHPRRRGGRDRPRPEHLHGRDDRDGEHPPQRDPPQPDHPRRGRARHQHVRRREHRLGRGRVHRAEPEEPHALRDALPRADRAGLALRDDQELQHRRARVAGRDHLSAADRRGRHGQELRHPRRAAGAACPTRWSSARRRSWRTWRTRRSTSATARRSPRKPCAGSAARRRPGSRTACN